MLSYTVDTGAYHDVYHGFEGTRVLDPPKEAKFLAVVQETDSLRLWWLESTEAADELRRYYKDHNPWDCEPDGLQLKLYNLGEDQDLLRHPGRMILYLQQGRPSSLKLDGEDVPFEIRDAQAPES